MSIQELMRRKKGEASGQIQEKTVDEFQPTSNEEKVVQDPNSWLISMDLIDIKDQVRDDEDKYTAEELEELALCIHTEGLFKPVVLIAKDDGRYDLEQGEHRFRSYDLLRKSHDISGVEISNQADYELIPARLSSGQRVPLRQLKENLFHKSMSPLSEAKVIQLAMDQYGWNQERAAKEFNKNQSWISRRLKLLKIAETAASKHQGQSQDANKLDQSGDVQANEKKGKHQGVERIAVEKGALQSVCQLLNFLSEKHGLPTINIDNKPSNMAIKKMIEQRVSEVLHAECQ